MMLTETRPSWDETFLAVARELAKRATCPRFHCGCVLTLDNRIISTGYNGALPGQPHCTDEGCLLRDDHCIRSLHAERNAVAHAARHGIALAGATAYVTGTPCLACFQMLAAAGIQVIVYEGDYRTDPLVLELAQSTGILLWCHLQKEKR